MQSARVISLIGLTLLACLVSLWWLCPGQLWSTSVPSPSAKPATRTYVETGGFDEPCTRSKQGRHFECSDGTKLYVITERFQTRSAANEAVARRQRLATSVSAGADPSERPAFGYETTSDVAFEIPRCFNPRTFAVIWARGCFVVGIYGPTLAHVRELEASFHPT